jgi:hypothetical protein
MRGAGRGLSLFSAGTPEERATGSAELVPSPNFLAVCLPPYGGYFVFMKAGVRPPLKLMPSKAQVSFGAV